ncbi:MAG: hypothetical protein EOO38_15335, partial [Cytophagaceae bacterium]
MSGNVIKKQIISLFRTEQTKLDPTQVQRREVRSKEAQHGQAPKPRLRRQQPLLLERGKTLSAQYDAGERQSAETRVGGRATHEGSRVAQKSDAKRQEGRVCSESDEQKRKLRPKAVTFSGIDTFEDSRTSSSSQRSSSEDSHTPSPIKRSSSLEAVLGRRSIAPDQSASLPAVLRQPKVAAPSASSSASAMLE